MFADSGTHKNSSFLCRWTWFDPLSTFLLVCYLLHNNICRNQKLKSVWALTAKCSSSGTVSVLKTVLLIRLLDILDRKDAWRVTERFLLWWNAAVRFCFYNLSATNKWPMRASAKMSYSVAIVSQYSSFFHQYFPPRSAIPWVAVICAGFFVSILRVFRQWLCQQQARRWLHFSHSMF